MPDHIAEADSSYDFKTGLDKLTEIKLIQDY